MGYIYSESDIFLRSDLITSNIKSLRKHSFLQNIHTFHEFPVN
jgi:hypothetical protein